MKGEKFVSFEAYSVQNRTIIITGGTGLIGQHYVRALVDAGARVILADKDETAAFWLKDSMESDNLTISAADITNPQSVRDMVERVKKKYGRINGLVNNAAVNPKMDSVNGSGHNLTFENYPLSLWQQSLDVNLTGMFLCTQAVAPEMLSQKKGVIVNISSIYGLVGPDQRLYQKDAQAHQTVFKPVDYSVTKAAVLGFTRYLAAYWGHQGIRVNTLTLGGVYHQHDGDFVKRYTWRTPMNRMARPDEYCAALIFLLSDASSYMTGSNLVIDGGWTSW
jgi:NAD(P)-dependent dehydrogenase (short-subunit alcohol dehydrogenase family)